MSLKNAINVIFVFLFALLVYAATFAEETAPDAVLNLVPSLQDWGKDAVLVTAVKQQNAKGVSLESIKQTDKEWMDAVGVTPFMQALMDNDAAKELKKLEASKGYYSEIFLMDNQGANVAMTNKTSDYWQGDEDKFIDAFKGGQGEVHIGKVKFDKSSQAYLVQVSVPVMDGGEAIGALTVGVNVDELEKVIGH